MIENKKDINKSEVKEAIAKVLISKIKSKITDWDGFVGDVPDSIKKSIIRDAKLKDILG